MLLLLSYSCGSKKNYFINNENKSLINIKDSTLQLDSLPKSGKDYILNELLDTNKKEFTHKWNYKKRKNKKIEQKKDDKVNNDEDTKFNRLIKKILNEVMNMLGSELRGIQVTVSRDIINTQKPIRASENEIKFTRELQNFIKIIKNNDDKGWVLKGLICHELGHIKNNHKGENIEQEKIADQEAGRFMKILKANEQQATLFIELSYNRGNNLGKALFRFVNGSIYEDPKIRIDTIKKYMK